MRLATGTVLGSYEIRAPLGAGGMGEVWRARDRRLDRDVALKVLPAAFVGDPERLARFEREAKVLASLNHPHIGGIYGLEEAHEDGPTVKALVLELVEGPTLADRIARGPIPIDEALPIARQIAEALEAAHEQGIVHRDLKPANIKVRPDGTVKVLDFGLAKALEPQLATAAAEFSQSPTLSISAAATQMGVILGTAAYMAPEQARGQLVDKRADIWAFGCVLYEMLTGSRPFEGETLSDTLAAVLRGEPSWEALPETVPLAMRRLLERCLQKSLVRRLRDAGDAQLELQEAERQWESADEKPSPIGASRRRGAWALALVAAAAMLALGLLLGRSARHAGPAAERARVEFEIHPPAGASFSTWVRGRPVISPDGKHVVFSAFDSNGERLWVRPLDALDAKPLRGTDDGWHPFWSADSRYVGFSSSSFGTVRRVGIGGGPPQILIEKLGQFGLGGTWNQRDEVLLSSGYEPLYRASAAVDAATSERLTTLEASRGEISHSEPEFLPDGEHFLFFVDSREAHATGTYAASLAAPDSRKLILVGSRASYASPGYLLFTQQGSLLAQPFDVERLEVTGEPKPVADRVAVMLGRGMYSTSDNEILTYREPFVSHARFTWFDREGNQLDVLPLPEGAQSPELSPDEERLAFERIDPETGWRDVWIWEFDRRAATKLTTHPANDSDPVWSPDGRFIIFSSSRRGYPSLHRMEVGSSEAPELIHEAQGEDYPSSWSADGRHVIVMRWSPGARGGKLLLLALSNGGEPKPFLDTDAQEISAQFSPDGKWVAYVTNKTGRDEVFVVPFPPTGEVRQASTDGGSDPRWSGDGRELCYLDPERKLMAVAVGSTGTAPQLSRPQELFQTRAGSLRGIGVRFSYDVSADGRRFLIETASTETRSSPIVVVSDWTRRLRDESH